MLRRARLLAWLCRNAVWAIRSKAPKSPRISRPAVSPKRSIHCLHMNAACSVSAPFLLAHAASRLCGAIGWGTGEMQDFTPCSGKTRRDTHRCCPATIGPTGATVEAVPAIKRPAVLRAHVETLTQIELAREACMIARASYLRLVEIGLFECEPLKHDRANALGDTHYEHDVPAARLDTTGVVCATWALLRHALVLEGVEKMDLHAYVLIATCLLIAQKAKTEQHWAEGQQAAAVTFSVCAPRDVTMGSTAAKMTAAITTAELRMLNSLPVFALCERNPHAATEAELHALVLAAVCTPQQAVDALRRFLPMYWQTAGLPEMDVWFGSADRGLAQSRRLGRALVCCLLPTLALHMDHEASALGAHISHLYSEKTERA